MSRCMTIGAGLQTACTAREDSVVQQKIMAAAEASLTGRILPPVAPGGHGGLEQSLRDAGAVADPVPDNRDPQPLVSVITPAYNSVATLQRAIDSVVAQSFTNWELVLIDDGSIDETHRLASELSQCDPRIRVYRQDNTGPSQARNRGIALARGRWISFLDADDTIAPDCLATLLAAVQNHAGPGGCADAAACGWARVDAQGVAHNPIIPAPGHFTLEWLCRNGPATHINAFLLPRREVLAVGSFDAALSSCEDWDLYIRLVRQGVGFAVVPQALAFYWQNDESLTKDGARLVRDTLTVRERCTRPDPRVPAPLPAYAGGLDQGDFASENLCSAMFWAGASIFAAMSMREVIAPLQVIPAGLSASEQNAYFLAGLESAAGGTAGVVARWARW